MNLHLQTVPARQGLAWIRHGFSVFKRRPLAMSSLSSFAMMLLLLLPLILPPLGIFTLLLPPLIWLGFMVATHEVLQGIAPKAGVFTASLRMTKERRKSQLLMSLVYGAIQLVVTLIAVAMFSDSFKAVVAVLSKTDPDEAAVMAAFTDPQWLNGVLAVLAAKILSSLPFLLAPALVHWGGQGVPQALFSSSMALWRNRGAFAVAIVVCIALFFAVSLVAPLAGLLGAQFGVIALTLALITLATVINCSLYFSFVDCFLSGSPDKLELK